MAYFISPPPQNPVQKIVATIIAIIVLGGAFMLGMVALLFVAGIGLFAGFVIWLRLTWIRYQLRKSGADAGTQDAPGQVIDAEYTIISEHEDQK